MPWTATVAQAKFRRTRNNRFFPPNKVIDLVRHMGHVQFSTKHTKGCTFVLIAKQGVGLLYVNDIYIEQGLETINHYELLAQCFNEIEKEIFWSVNRDEISMWLEDHQAFLRQVRPATYRLKPLTVGQWEVDRRWRGNTTIDTKALTPVQVGFFNTVHTWLSNQRNIFIDFENLLCSQCEWHGLMYLASMEDVAVHLDEHLSYGDVVAEKSLVCLRSAM